MKYCDKFIIHTALAQLADLPARAKAHVAQLADLPARAKAHVAQLVERRIRNA